MAAIKKTFDARENGRPKSVSRLVLVIISIFIVGLATAVFLINRPRGSRVARGTRGLIEAFSNRRLIEPRLSGGFKRGEYKPDDPEPAPALGKAREPILDAVASGEPGADLAYARLLLSEGEKDPDAIKHLRLALAVSPDSAEVNNDLGVALFLDGKIEGALDTFEALLNRNADMREALFNRGLCYQRLLLRDAAAADYRRLLTIESDPGWLSEINHRLAEASASLAPRRKASEVLTAFDAALDSGNIDEAKSITRQNLEVVNKFATNDQTVEFLKQAAAGEHQKAEHSLWKIELITRLFFEATGDASTSQFADYLRRLPHSELSRELNLIDDYLESTRMFTSKNYSQAQVRFEELSKQFASRGNDWLQVNCTCYASFCLYASGHLTASINKLKDVLRDISSRKWIYLRGHILLQLGGACARLGQDSLAIRYCEQNLKNSSALPLLEAKSLQYMGNAYWHLGDLDKALTYLRGSTESYLSSVPAPEELGYNYLQLADIYRLRGNHSLALLDARQAIVFLTQTNDYNHASQAASFIAVEYARLGEGEQADKSMNEAFGYLKKTNADLQTYSEPLLLTRAGEMEATRGDTDRAVERYQHAEVLANKSEDKKLLLLRILRGRAEAYARARKYDKARNDLARGIDLIERYRSGIAGSADRSAFLDASQGVFDQLLSLNISVFHREPDAFNVSEESRARTLLDELSSRKDNSSRNADSRSGDADAMRLAPAVKLLSLKAVQRELPDDVRLMTYSVTPRGTYVFLVTRSRFEVATSPATTETLDRLTTDYVSDIERLAPIEALSVEARELYRLLIKPIENQIADGKRLCIVPDKALHFLPFAALVDETGRYLVESHRLSYAPSASALVNCLRVARTKGAITSDKIFAVGNPRFDRETFPKLDPLPDSEREANTIASFYSSSVVRTGERATIREIEEQLKGCDVAHMAVHCLVEEKSPWLAALVLSPEPGTVAHPAVSRPHSPSNDGLLYLNEIYGFSLPRTRLVVLSACRSGLGQYYRGEGIVSLARPFLALRVPTVVASLWSVDSEATAELMIEFHRRRTAGNRETSDALCDAQITLAHRASYTHPYYWAPFITLGSN